MLVLERQPTITGIGGVLGSESISNQELIARTGIQSTPEWITEHTGIEHRFWAEEGALASDLGVQAARQALAQSGITGSELAGIYLTTLTPDYFGPYTATEIHKQLEAGQECFAYELVTACTGAVAALSHAADQVTLRPDSKILTVGTDLMSRIINFQDRRSVILFGDGAGATIVQAVPDSEAPVFSHATSPDREAIYAPAGGLAEPGHGPNHVRNKLQMNGKQVAKHALTLMPKVLIDTAKQDGAFDVKTSKIDWDRYGLFVPHQANGILINAMWGALKVPEEKRLLTVDQHGNTSSASILLALRHAHEEGRLDGHTRILMTSIGAGMMAVGGAMDVNIGWQQS